MTAVKAVVRRQTNAMIREGGKLRPLVVEIHPGDYLSLRAKGCKAYDLGIRAAYIMAVTAYVDQKRAERKAKRKLKKKGR